MNFSEFKKYILELAALSLPILAGNIGQMLISLADVYVAGHYSTNTLAAISVASGIFMTFIISGIGLCCGITPVLSNLRGEKQPVRKFFGVTVLYSQILALIFFILMWLLIPFVYKMGLNEAIVEDTVIYLKISTYSIFGIFLFTAIKEFLQAHEIVFFPNALIIGSVIINVILNFALVYGMGPIPSLGTAGLAVASLLVRVGIGIILFGYCVRLLRRNIYTSAKYYVKNLIQTGMPIAAAMFIEFFGFNIVAILVGRFAPVYAACHNIVLSITSLTYMIPFSLSNALSVKVGYANGGRSVSDIKKYTLTAFIFILIYSAAAFTIYTVFKEDLMRIFSSDTNVIKTGAAIMVIVACFTTFDGIQGVCMGALKGMKQTLQMMVVMFASYFIVSIPLGIVLAYKFNLILKGFWLGLAFGIFTASVISSGLYLKKYFSLKKKFNLTV